MTDSVLLTLVFGSVSLPVLVFLLVALLTNPTGSDADAEEYLIADGEASGGDFINSSTGYMIQVSTTFYFIYWGYNYGLSNIFYVLSWSLGIMLFSLFVGQLYSNRKLINSIPSFLGRNTSRYIRPLSAIAAIISFGCVFYVEAFFTSDLISGFGNPDGSSESFTPQWWATFLIIVIVVALYSALGGLKKVIATDVWQLSIAYLGFSVVFAYLIVQSFETSSSTAWLLSGLSIAIYLAFLITDKNLRDGKVKLISILLSLAILFTAMLSGAYFGEGVDNDLLIDGVFKQVTEPWGWFTLSGFVLLNGLWQFADSSNFQRISAINLSDKKEVGVLELRKLIRKLAIISPLTWGLGIILGMLIKSAMIPVTGAGLEYQGLIAHLQLEAASGNVFSILVIISLIAGLVSIMMSTCDSAIIAATLNFSTDIRKSSTFTFTGASIFALAVVIFVLLLAVFHSYRSANTSILTVMAGAYSAIIVLAPITIQRLCGYVANPLVVSVAIVFGVVGAFVATFGPIGSLPFNVQLVLPIFVAVGISSAVILLGMPFSKKDTSLQSELTETV